MLHNYTCKLKEIILPSHKRSKKKTLRGEEEVEEVWEVNNIFFFNLKTGIAIPFCY